MVRPTAPRRIPPLQPGRCEDCPVRKFTPYSGVPVASLKFLQAARPVDRIVPPKRNIVWERKAALSQLFRAKHPVVAVCALMTPAAILTAELALAQIQPEETANAPQRMVVAAAPR